MGGTRGPTNEQRAMEYYKHAAEFTDAYGKLSHADAARSATAKDLLQPSVKLLILGHALELSMKGWLVLYEGIPVHLTKGQKRTLAQARQPIPTTLKDYSHDLEHLADATVKYYPGLQPCLDKVIPRVNADGDPVLDAQGNQQLKSLIEHLNSSYWAGGARQYEYPEASEVAEQKSLAFLSPLDKFAEVVSACRHALLNAIIAQNGGTVPQPYRVSSTP